MFSDDEFPSGGGVERAPAKVNLHLHVLGRRADGFHLLDSLVVFAGAHDVLRATPAEAWSLEVTGPWRHALGDSAENLVLRAATALAAAAGGPPMRLMLEKNLPVASGIGGGSADAAATLRLLSRLWDRGLDGPAARDAARLALSLGADVPVCLAGRAARMGGIGEALADAPRLPPFGLLLVNPGVPVPTGAVFAARAGAWSRAAALPAGWATTAAMAADLRAPRNDLQDAAIGLAPIIGETIAAIERLPGCRLARMSGSGATCFGLFDDPAAARAAAVTVTAARAAWWCWGGAAEPGRAVAS